LLSNHEKQLEQYKLADKRQHDFERLNKRNLRGALILILARKPLLLPQPQSRRTFSTSRLKPAAALSFRTPFPLTRSWAGAGWWRKATKTRRAS
jgi:hypothetical protein